ncbi:MAG: CYTH and CHAD domain-containing protein [Pseudomonadota bacterium]
MPEETELKLSLRPEQAGRIGRHPVVQKLKSGPAETKRLLGTYYDTPDLLLRRKDVSLRVREVDHRFIQTLKRMQPSRGAVFSRDEWETDVGGRDPDINEIEDGEIRRMLRKNGAAKSLRPMFRTDVRRTTWQLRDKDAEIELALDIGEVRNENGDRTPICEAELELKSGDARRLYDIALALNEKIDCVVGTVAKSDLGYALYERKSSTPVKASKVPLVRDMTVWQAFETICRSCLDQLEANAPIARVGQDPEGIHQARVANRRLRAAFKIFKRVLPQDRYESFATELRWLQKELGDARDLDVFLDEMLDPMIERLPRERLLKAFRKRVKEARLTAYARARRALEGRRYGRLRLAFERWFADAPGPDADPRLGRNVRWFAKRSIRKVHAKIVAVGIDLHDVSDAELHAIRIKGKQLRYCIEFFSGLFDGDGPRHHAKALSRIQDCLGSLNDGVVAHTLIRKLGRKGSLDPRVKALVGGWFAARIHDERANLGEAWGRFTALRPFWV